MCLGVVPWSGVRHPICGTRSEDAEVVGFDERPKRAEWVRSLEECGVIAERDVLRDEAASMLRWYAEEGGETYSGCQAPRLGTPWGRWSGCGNRPL